MSLNGGTDNLSRTLEKLANHMDLLASQVFEVEEALGKLIATDKPKSGASITKFQALDFVRQSLEDSALLFQVMSTDTAIKESNIKISCDHRNKLKLDATKAILFGNSPQINRTDSGELDLF